MKLNINILNNEFLMWTGDFGNGRNKQDLRFGQFMYLKYNIDIKKQEGFYDEIPRYSYSKIINNLNNKIDT